MAVSGNIPDPDDDPVNFAALSPEEQRAVAERLLKIKESDWKPFWCPDTECNGDPHRLYDGGALSLVDASTVTGPAGETVGGRVWATPGGDWVFEDDGEVGIPGEDTLLGRVLFDPMWSHNHARADQRLPGWLKPWTLFIMSGRGTGKTTTGVEFVTLNARKGLDGAILGRRGTELVNTHVKALMARAHPDFMPIHWASKDILEWPNGAITYLFSAEKPENIRSVNLSYYWIDEAAFMDQIETAHMNLKLATRVKSPGNPIHVLITSTPTGSKWVQKMEDDPNVIIRRVSTYANKANLDADFLAELVRDLEGTRMGRQELHGEVLRDVPGAMWNDDMFSHLSCPDPAEFANLCDSMDEVVVAVDPAGTANKRSDETGVIAVGVQRTDEDGNELDASRFYVLADGTIKGTPTEWARQVYKVALLTRAHRIVAEKTYGGDMVKQVMSDFADLHPDEAIGIDGENLRDIIKVVDARQSKETRAEATVGKYEQGRVLHVTSPGAFGDLSTLEREQTTWVPRSRGGKSPSPNRVDALVWAVRALESATRYKGSVASASATHARTMPGPVASPVGPVLPVVPETRQRLVSAPKDAPMPPKARQVLAAPQAKPIKTTAPKTKRPPGIYKR